MVKEVVKILESKNIYPTNVYEEGKKVAVLLEWADWKEHVRVDAVVEEVYGDCRIQSKVVDTDGSDCYSAIHYFTIVAEDNSDDYYSTARKVVRSARRAEHYEAISRGITEEVFG